MTMMMMTMIKRFIAATLLSAAAAITAQAQPVAPQSVGAAEHHACAITPTGGVKCWGWNELGQLGNGSVVDSNVPVDVVGLSSGVVAVTTFWGHSCALTSSGGMKCWGNNYYGQLGDGTTTQRETPVDVTGLTSGVIQISAGSGHVCALLSTSAVKCWGNNGWGQIAGPVAGGRESLPVEALPATSGTTFISAGVDHTCAVLAGGTVKCWGANFDGQLGTGTTNLPWLPAQVVGLTSGASQVSAGWEHTCATMVAGGIKCWGDNTYGQLGNGGSAASLVPVDVSGVAGGYNNFSTGNWRSCFVVNATGGLKCWGSVFGYGDSAVPIDPPQLTSGVAQAALGNSTSCFKYTDGSVKCRGTNQYGGVGDGSNEGRVFPVEVVGFASSSLQSQSISFGTLADQPIGLSPLAISATSDSGLAVTFTSLTPGTCSVSGSSVSLLAAGACSIAANQAGNAAYAPAPQLVRTFNIIAATSQTITFAAIPDKTIGAAPFAITATASSGLPVSFSALTPLVCTVSGSTVTLLSGSPCTIAANQPGNATYAAAAQVTRTFTISKASQTITFATISTKTLLNTPLALAATASSGLTVSFASTTPAICTVSGSTATLLTAGTCGITASQAGNASFNAAAPVARTFSVTKVSQTITFASITTKTLLNTPLALTATSNSGLAVVLSSTTPAICTVSGTSATLLAAGSCSIVASQPGDSAYNAATSVTRTFSVTKASQTITLATISNRAYSATPFQISPTVSSGLPLALASTTPAVCSVATDAGVTRVTMLAAGTCTITANQAGSTVYNAATQVTRSFTISKLSQTLTIDTISTKNLGDATFVPDVTNTSGLPVAIATTTASVCTASNNAVTIIATGTCTITANASATAIYNAASQKTLSFTVAAARAVQIYYVHTDQIDTPRQITAASNNAVVWRWDNQDAFGDNLPVEKPSGSGQAFKYHLRFAGQIYDQETDTSYNYFRDYDANLGRYVQSDPIGLAGGISTYGYVGGNPLSHADPTGLIFPALGAWIMVNAPWLIPTSTEIVAIGLMLSSGANAPGPAGVGATAVSALRPTAAAAKALAGEICENAALARRVSALHSVLDPLAANRRTTAMVSTAQGAQVAAAGGRDLSPAQRAVAMGMGADVAKANGLHAEVTALGEALANGLTPAMLVASRPFCPACRAAISASGGTITGPATAAWKR
jgi:RHS repeat-associated protein